MSWTSSSNTILTIWSAGLTRSSTSWPTACASTRPMKSLVTLKLTSASRKARRTSRRPSRMLSAVRRPRPRNLFSASFKLRWILSNMRSSPSEKERGRKLNFRRRVLSLQRHARSGGRNPDKLRTRQVARLWNEFQKQLSLRYVSIGRSNTSGSWPLSAATWARRHELMPVILLLERQTVPEPAESRDVLPQASVRRPIASAGVLVRETSEVLPLQFRQEVQEIVEGIWERHRQLRANRTRGFFLVVAAKVEYLGAGPSIQRDGSVPMSRHVRSSECAL